MIQIYSCLDQPSKKKMLGPITPPLIGKFVDSNLSGFEDGSEYALARAIYITNTHLVKQYNPEINNTVKVPGCMGTTGNVPDEIGHKMMQLFRESGWHVWYEVGHSVDIRDHGRYFYFHR